ncbi:MAG: 1-acyl-sn-glycerol-3-phosphate acyltransferase [Lachnospiraceae bacterium]|nr:1-acyl-sn-glycerol-3-phosphate acyltransferase [Lachnospiraceae bacterium]
MFRFILIMIGLVLFLLVTIPIQLIMLIVRLFSKRASACASLTIVSGAFHLLKFIAGTKVTYRGLENVPKDEAVLYVMNHRSYFDIITTYPKAKRPTGYISKDGLAKVPSLSWWMRLLGCGFMDRKDIKKGLQTINESAEKIKNGFSITICPEGTRNKTNDPLMEFKGGALKIAEKAGCKIVPVVCNGTDEVWEKQFPKIRPTKVLVEYLPPIDVGAMDKAQRKGLTDMVHKCMWDCYVRNDQERKESAKQGK